MFHLLLDKQFQRFIAVGILNTFFGYGMFALFIYLQLHYSVASFLATVLGVLFNFKTTGKIVFESHDNGLIFRFFGVYGITYIVSVFFLYIFEQFAINMYLAGALLLLPMAVFSFLMNRHFVFQNRRNNEKED